MLRRGGIERTLVDDLLSDALAVRPDTARALQRNAEMAARVDQARHLLGTVVEAMRAEGHDVRDAKRVIARVWDAALTEATRDADLWMELYLRHGRGRLKRPV